MKTKTLSLVRERLSVITVFFLCAFLFSFSFVHAASTDYYIKIDGVDGESTKSNTAPQRTEVNAQSVKTAEVQTYPYRPTPDEKPQPTPGVEREEIGFTDDNDDGDENATNFGVLLEGGSGEDATGEDVQEGKGNVEYGWKVEEGERISVEARELQELGEEEKQEFLSEVKTFAELQSKQDLENFARGILLEDENLLKVQFNPKKLSVSRKASGKLLGFIPVIYTEEMVASGEDGSDVEITVKLPWWSFLLSPDIDPEELVTEAKKKHKETIEIDSWSWGASNAGSLLKAISDVIKTKHDTAKNSVSNLR